MADVDLEAGISWNGSEEQLGAILTNSIEGAFAKLGPKLAKQFAAAFKSAFSDIDNDVVNQFKNTQKEADNLADRLRDVEDRLKDLGKSANAARGSFGETFDPNNLNAFESAIENIIRLQDEMARDGADPAILEQLRQIGALAKSELTATRVEFQQVALAQREAAQNSTRDTRQESKERIAVINDEKARFVTATQTASAKEVAILRSSTQLQVAEAQSAAKRRAATFQLVGRVVQSVERGIRSAFQATARVVSTSLNAASRVATSAFSGISRVASSSAAAIGNVFRRGNRTVVNEFGDANSNITKNYRSSFRKNTQIVNNELNEQESRVKRFASEASSSIGGISLGRLGGFAAVGALAGRALRGGFERAATLEDSERALTTLLGSVEDAQKLRDGVLKVVTGTPFKLDQFADAATQLVAFNLEADKIPRVLSAIADAAAVRGGNAGQTIDSLVDTFGQITATGRIMGDDLNRIASAGVPALQILGNAYGKTGEEMRKMISDGAVPASEAIEILTSGILEGSDGVQGATAAFAGLAQELGGTLRGSIGNFGAAMDRLGANVITLFGPQLVAVVQGATASIDLLGKIVMSVASAVATSPVFKLIASRLGDVSKSIKEAGDRLKPVFDFLGDGLVTLLTAVGGLAALRRIPLFINVVGFALRRLLTPMNLLIGAGLLISSFLTRLVRENPELSSALKALGASFGQIATIVTDLAADAFGALSTVIEGAVVPAVSFLADKVESAVLPALEGLNRFLTGKVIPALRTASNFIRTTVVPAIGDGLVRALEIGRNAFSEFVKFITVAFGILARGDFTGGDGWLSEDGRVVDILFRIREAFQEVVRFAQVAFGILIKGGAQLGSEGWLAYDGPVVGGLFRIRQAFKDLYGFVSGTFLPFVKADLVPVLAGLGAALAALSFGNLPLAGLLAGGGLAVAAFRNDDLRASVIGFFDKVIEDVRKRFASLFDGNTLRDVAVGALKLIRKVGEVLGKIASDPRLLAGFAALVAAAAAAAAAFVTGFVEGVASNVPAIARGISAAITEALKLALKGLVSSPALGTLALGLFGSGLFLRGVAKAGKAATAEFARAASFGPGNQFRPQATGIGAFTRSLIGGPDAISKNIQQQFKAAEAVTIREGQRLQRVAQQIVGPAGIRNPKGQFLKQTDARGIADGYDKITAAAGKTNTAAGLLRAGVSDLRTGFTNLRTDSGKIADGLRSVGEGAKIAFKQFGQNAGIAAGATFAGAFMSQAAFDMDASRNQRLQGAVGALSAGLTAGVLTGNAGIGAGVAAVSLLGGAFLASRERADRLKQSIEELGRELADLNPAEAAERIDATVLQAFLDAGSDTQDLLNELNISYLEFSAALSEGRGVEFIATQLEKLGPAGEAAAEGLRNGTISLGRIDDALTQFGLVEDLKAIKDEIGAAGFDVDTYANALGVLGETTKQVGGATGDAARNITTMAGGIAGAALAANNQGIRDWAEASAAATDVAATATQAYRDKLNELNQVRIDGLRAKVDDAKGALDAAGQAADEAKEKLRQYLAGETVESTLEKQVNDTIIGVANIAEQLGGLDLNLIKDKATFDNQIAEVQGQVAGILSEAQPASPEELAGLIAPLQTAIGQAELGPELTAALQGGIDAAVAAFNTDQSKSLLGDIFNIEESLPGLQAQLDSAELNLEVGIDLPPTLFDGLVSGAQAAFDEAGEGAVTGFAEGIGGSTVGADAARTMAENALAEAKAALGISSPSTAFAALGGFAVDGYAQGMISSTGVAAGASVQVARTAVSTFAGALLGQRGVASAAGFQVGLASMQGFRNGVVAGSGSVLAAARGIANAAAATMRQALDVQSPSKVTTVIGRFFGEGFAEGITDSTSSALTAAVNMANRALAPLTNAGKAAAKAIGRGFAEGGTDFLGSVSSAIDKAYTDALSKADQFKVIGQRIASNLFERQGSNDAGLLTGRGVWAGQQSGGMLGAQVALANLEARSIARTFRDNTKQLLDDKGFYALTFNQRDRLGQENQKEFLEAGLKIRDFGSTLLDAGFGAQYVAAVTKQLRDQLLSAANARGLGLGINAGISNSLLNTLGLTNKQLDDFVKSVRNVESAAKAATKAEEERLRVESQGRGASANTPVFRDLVVQAPTGNPEAVALFVANRVAWNARR
jgi:tape measure domain-containing protein